MQPLIINISQKKFPKTLSFFHKLVWTGGQIAVESGFKMLFTP